jgi:thiamine-monophosphate kinase
MTNRRASAAPMSGEDRLIARHFKPLALHPGALGLTDDAAALKLSARHDLVLTTDAIVGGVHFLPDDPSSTIARKALRVNLSDLAAKGATPVGFLLTLALPRRFGDAWVAAFARALGEDAQRYDCPLLGGDTVTTPGPVLVSVAAFGSVPVGGMVRRRGAQVGDHVLVTGAIGDAALGLRLRKDRKVERRWGLTRGDSNYLRRRYLVPEPRNALAFAIRKYATAAMDVSDGLVGDLSKLCRASNVAVEVDAARVPISAAARRALRAEPRLLKTMLSGGDDYEIVCTVRPAKLSSFQAAALAIGLPVSAVGRIVSGGGATFRGADGRPMAFARGSFSHF